MSLQGQCSVFASGQDNPSVGGQALQCCHRTARSRCRLSEAADAMTACCRCDTPLLDQEQEAELGGGQPLGAPSSGVGVLLDLVHVLVKQLEVGAALPAFVVVPAPAGARGRH